MRANLENQIFLTAILEMDGELDRSLHILESNRYLEFGDDPRIVREIEQSLRQVIKHMQTLGTQFDLLRVPLSKANNYYRALYLTREALDFVQNIREQSVGSIRHTRQCITQIEACANSIRQIESFSQSQAGMIQ